MKHAGYGQDVCGSVVSERRGIRTRAAMVRGVVDDGMGVARGELNVGDWRSENMVGEHNMLSHAMLQAWHVFCQSTGRAGKTLRCPV